MTTDEKKALRTKIDAWFDANKQAMLRDLSALIDVESVRGEAQPGMPYGPGPAAALDKAQEILKNAGFSPVNHDHHVVTADLSDAEPVLGILTHVDTVGTGDGWSTDPHIAVTRDGKIYGRGAIDNKGPTVAAVYALRAARELVPSLTKGCRLILGSAEETGHEDLVHYRQKSEIPPNVFTPDAQYPVVNVEKGRYSVTFSASWQENDALPRIIKINGGTTQNVVPNIAEAYLEGLPFPYIQALCVVMSAKTGARIWAVEFRNGLRIRAVGKGAHAMHPETGVNAQSALLSVLRELPLPQGGCRKAIKALAKLFPFGDTSGTALGVAMEDETSGPLTLNFGVLTLDNTGVTAGFDCRTPETATSQTLDAVAEQALADAGFTITDVSKTAHHHTPADTPFVQTLLNVYEDYTGDKGECLVMGGQTYVHDIDGGVAFGPAFPGVNNRLHAANEFIGIDELLLSAKMYTQVIIDMCS